MEWPDDDLNNNLYGLQQDFEPKPQTLFRAPLTPYLVTEVQTAPILPTNRTDSETHKQNKTPQPHKTAKTRTAPRHTLKKTKHL